MSLPVPAQVVNDSTTNTLNGVTSNVTGTVTIGTNGSFTLLALTNGALLTNSGLGVIGRNAGANSNTVRLTGANTRWLMSLDLFLGSNGSFNKLFVSNGALVGDQFGYIGLLPTSISNAAFVTGTGSVWSNRSNLYLGFSGNGNRLFISNAGQVFSHSGVIGADVTSSNNEALVTGTNSFWSNRNQVIVGALGSNNRLTVSNGASVFTSNEVILGLLSGSVSNLLLLSGGALLTNGGRGIIGADSNANFNTAILSGTNSRWLLGDQVIVGSNGAFNSLVITNGASLGNDVGGVLGVGAAASSNLALVSGAGSRWVVTGILEVGASGTANRMVVSNGAFVGSDRGFVGASATASNNEVVVTGPGSFWSNQMDLNLGFKSDANRLVVSNGGLIGSDSGRIGASGGSSNAIAVTGAGSLWSNRTLVNVGESGHGNTLVVSNAATVFASNDVSVGFALNASNNLLLVTAGALLTNGGDGILGVASNANFNRALISDANSRWFVGGALIVGSNGAFNTLTVSNGAMLSSGPGRIGFGLGDGNRAVVTGPGSEWTAGLLTVGQSNASGGALVVSNGGHVRLTGGTATVGADVGSANNTIIVDGPGSLLTNGFGLLLGSQSASNTLIVTNGGQVVISGGPGAGLTVGSSTNAHANRVLLAGAGTVLNERKATVIGASGADNQFITSLGAAFTSPSVAIGTAATGSNNAAIVTGSNSTWTITNTVTVGAGGANNLLVVSNGGAAFVSNSLVVGSTTNSLNNRVIVNGGTLRVANSTNGGTLDIRRGTNVLKDGLIDVDQLVMANSTGVFTFDGGALLTRGAFISNGASFTVNGGGVWDVRAGVSNHFVDGQLIVGDSSDNNFLIITNGALLTNDGTSTLGVKDSDSGNVALIRGAGSQWLMSGSLRLGGTGSGNALIVSNGGVVANGDGFVGTGGDNNLAVVTGASLWSNRLDLVVGDGGSGNRLLVSNGATVFASNAVIIGSTGVPTNNLLLVSSSALVTNGGNGILGLDTGANFNTASFSGTNTRWLMAGDLYVGSNGAFNQLVVSNGALARSAFGRIGQTAAGSNNVAVVTGPNSVWTNQVLLSVGIGGGGNRLVVSNGGLVVNSDGDLGFNTSSSNNEAWVTGAGSLWSNRIDLDVGRAGSGNRLTISNGGTVFALNVIVGEFNTSLNNRVVVDGGTLRATNAASTSVLDVRRGTNVLNVGLIDVNRLLVTNSEGFFEFNGGTLITRGAVVENGGLVFSIGNSSANPAVWDVRAGTNTVTSPLMRLGNGSPSGQLLITNGALLTQDCDAWIGTGPGGQSNVASVSGSNSRWVINGGNGLFLGSNGAFNRLVISNGAFVDVNQNSALGVGATASNNEAVVTGPGSIWNIHCDFTLGSSGSGNRLVVSNGGIVINDQGTLGSSATSSNNEALVTGTDSVWSNRFSLVVGSSGSRNLLVVTNGATVYGMQGIILGSTTNSTNNRVIVDGGTLVTTNAMDVRRGTNVLNTGLIDVNRLLVTNALGVFEFNGGTLITANGTNSNGRVFRVGNGTNAATLQLNGGTHGFSNNLVISTNASLIGTGTILGSVTNFGTIGAGTSPGSLRINGDLRLQASARMSFELGGLIPTNQYDQIVVTNLVQFAGILSLTLINNFLPNASDSFTLFKFASTSGSFTNTPNGSRVDLTNHLANFVVTYSTTNFVLAGVRYVDTDGDGQGDLQEQAAGSSPTDSAVYLEVTSLTRNASNHIVIQFQSVAGKSYRIEHTTNLNSGFNGFILSPSLTAPATNVSQWIDDGSLTGGLSVGQRFYRIGLQ
ncbi:MAG TPA: hypothetical protein VI454_05750 [Verrucomicrobiae bacterium]